MNLLLILKDQFALEQYFHYRLLHSTYLTNNTAEADFFYIPFYGNLVEISGLSNSWYYYWFWNYTVHLPLIKKFPQRHLVVYGGVEQFNTRFMGMSKLSQILTFVMVERTALKNGSSNVIVAPYPSHIHFYPDKQYQVDYTKKDIFVSSSWKTRTILRRQLIRVCNKSKECFHMETVPHYNRSYVFDVTSRSVFCLSPSGDSATRKAFWDAVTVGCINVIFDADVKYPFDDTINYENFTVYIPKHLVDNTIKILKAIPEDQIKAKQRYIDLHKEKFQYTIVPNKTSRMLTNDAFDMILVDVYKQANLTHKLQ